MTNRPRISVIITTYNYERFVRDAIDSVLAQTRLPDEIVVIDDGSTDNTRKIVDEYADRHVTYIWQENAGAGAARNRGIAATTGEFVAFLDADDIWLPTRLERQECLLIDHPDAVLATGHMIWWDVARNQRRFERFGDMPSAKIQREILVRNVVGNPSMVLVRRNALDAAGPYDRRLRWGQDWELFIRITRVGEVVTVDEPVIVYRWHGESLSHQQRWTRLSTLHGIHRRAVRSHSPSWQRPWLRARMWSAIELDRARMSLPGPRARVRVPWHATRSLVSYPLDRGIEKCKLVVRGVLGERRYKASTASLRDVRVAARRRVLDRF